MRRRLFPLALVAGTLVPAIGASPVGAQLCGLLPCTTTTTTTTTTAPASTTTTSSSTSTTTEAAAAASGGGLSISTPTSAVLSAGTPVSAGTLSALLGQVEVVDQRAGLGRGWTATVTTTDFATGGGTPPETISRSNVWYWSGPAVATSGVAVFAPGQLTGALAVPLSTARPAFSATAGTGSVVSATWTPTITVQLPPTAIVGEYRGTITHSVA